MISFRYRSLLRQPWHPSTEELLLCLDGEIKAKMHSKVEEHLKVCWSCRIKRQRIDHLISDYMEHRKIQRASSPSFPGQGVSRFINRLEQLDLESGRPPILSSLVSSVTSEVLPRGFSLRLAVCLLSSCLILLVFIWTSSAPPVSAKEFLQRAQYAEIQQIRHVPAPVVYQKLQVYRHSSLSGQEETEVWEIWNDASHDRLRQRVEDASGPRFIPMGTHNGKPQAVILAELEEVFQANRMDWRRPLSAASYQGWRESIRVESEKVIETKSPKGGRVLALKTAAAGPFARSAIVQAELIVRAEDWHPVEQRLKVQGEHEVRDYHLTEAAFEVLALNTLTPSIFADLTPSPPTLTPRVRNPLSTPAPSAAELVTAEIEVCYALHRLKACLGEPLELVRNGVGSIEVRGLTETQQRKEELTAALEGIPLVATKIQTVEEATISVPLSPRVPMEQADPSSSKEYSIVEVQSAKLPIEDQLEEYFSQVQVTGSSRQREEGKEPVSTRKKIAELSTKVVSLSDAVLAEAWALRRLAERYPEWQRESLRPATRWLLEVMLRDHLTGLRTQIGGYRSLVGPVLSSLGSKDVVVSGPNAPEASGLPESGHSGWVTPALHVFSKVEHVMRLTNYLFAGADFPGERADEATQALLADLYQLNSDFQGLEVAIAREFTDVRDLLALKDGAR